MRVSEPMLKQLALVSNAKNKKALFDAGEPLMTGQNINRPSDDPLAAQRVVELDQVLAKFNAYEKARVRVDFDLQTADSTLQTTQGILGDLRELAIQMANDNYNPENRSAAAQEVATLRKQLLALANTQQADGRYLFAGVSEGAAAYDQITGDFVGSEKNREVEILPGLFVDATLTGAQTFGGTPGPTIFQEIDGLVTALQNNDIPGVVQAIGELDSAIGKIGVAQARVGGQLANLDQAALTGEDLKFNLTIQRAEKQDPDIATQATLYASAETALTGSIELTKRLISSTLLQWLR